MRGRWALPILLAACAPGEKRPAPADGEEIAPGVAPALCYRSDGAVLSRLADPVRRTPGWLRLEGGSGADSGAGQLVDSGGAALDLSWIRTPGDSLVMRGADDFVRFEAQLARTDSGLSGPARIFSDAQLEQSAGGERRPTERTWVLRAQPALCDSAPVPWTEDP